MHDVIEDVGHTEGIEEQQIVVEANAPASTIPQARARAPAALRVNRANTTPPGPGSRQSSRSRACGSVFDSLNRSNSGCATSSSSPKGRTKNR